MNEKHQSIDSDEDFVIDGFEQLNGIYVDKEQACKILGIAPATINNAIYRNKDIDYVNGCVHFRSAFNYLKGSDRRRENGAQNTRSSYPDVTSFHIDEVEGGEMVSFICRKGDALKVVDRVMNNERWRLISEKQRSAANKKDSPELWEMSYTIGDK